jgi:hypothetical protein
MPVVILYRRVRAGSSCLQSAGESDQPSGVSPVVGRARGQCFTRKPYGLVWGGRAPWRR